MKIESFFAKAKKFIDRNPTTSRALQISVYDYREEEGGGYRIDVARMCTFGDTIEEALDAAFDALTGRPSKRARLNPPDISNGNQIFPARRLKFDYRTKDYAVNARRKQREQE